MTFGNAEPPVRVYDEANHGTRTLATKATALFVAIATLLACVLVAPAANAAANYDLSGAQSGWVDGDETKVIIGGKDYTPGMSVNYGDSVKVQLHWKVPNKDITIGEGDTFTYDLPAGIAFQSEGPINMLCGDGNVCGSFTINGNHIVATYTRADTSGESGGNVTAFVTANGTITSKATDGNDGGKTEFEFPGYGKVEVDIAPIHQLSAYKNGAVSTDDPSVFYFVVDVKSTGTNDNVRLDDTMGNLLNLQTDPPLEIYTDQELSKPYTGDWSVLKKDEHSFSVNIDHMKDGEQLHVKYYVKVDRQAVSDAIKADKNTALVRNTVKYSSDNDTTKKETSQSIWINNSWTVEKKGSASTNGDGTASITWTITVVPDPGATMKTKTLVQDILGQGLQEPTGDITITSMHTRWYDGNPDVTTVSWEDLKSGKATLPNLPTDNTKPYAEYRITYTTKVDKVPEEGSGDKDKYTNRAEITPGDGSGTSSGSGSVTIGQDAVNLSKSYVGSATEKQTLQWMTTFTAKDNLPAGKVLTDTVDQDENGKTYGDYQLVSANADDITIYLDKDRKNKYTGNVTKTIAADRKSFKITFNDAIPQNTKLYIFYSSQVKVGTPDGTKFYNTVNFVKKDADANYKPVIDNLSKGNRYTGDKTDGNKLTPQERNLFRWELKVHDIPSGTKDVTITDTLPKYDDGSCALVYVSDSLRAMNSKGTTFAGASVIDNGNCTLTFTLARNSAAFAQAQTGNGLYLVYDTTYADLTKAKDNIKYTNSAQISVDGALQLPDTSTITAGKASLVKKVGTYDKNTAPYINYTVQVNPGAMTLNKGNTLELTDTLGPALALLMNSVSIVDANTKQEVLGATYSYDPATRTTVFKVPDGRAITITYKATVLLKPGTDFTWDTGSNASNASNKIVLKGYGNNGGSSETTQWGKVQEAQGGFSFSSNALQIYKYADGDTTKPLNGAEFTVERLNNVDMTQGKTWESDKKPTTIASGLTSGTNGYTSAVALKSDTIYKITETKAPEGYVDKDLPTKYIVFPGNDHNWEFYKDATIDGSELYSVVIDDDKHTTLQTYLWAVSNKRGIEKSFTLNKQDESGKPLAGAAFELTKDGDSSFAPQYWTANDNESSHTFEKLTPGTYTLTETQAPNGYQTAKPVTIVVSESGTVIVDGKNASDANGNNVVTVTDASATTKIRATKVWNDGDNQDGGRGVVTFQLYKTVGGKEQHLSNRDQVIRPSATGSDLTVEWDDLPVKEGGQDVTYSVKEQYTAAVGFDGYTQSGPDCKADGDGVQNCAFTNSYTPKTTQVTVTKRWDDADDQDGIRPDSVKVQLYANGEKMEDTQYEVTLNGDNEWSHTWTDLPVYRDGTPISYTVKEDKVPNGYAVTVNGNATDGFVVTNTHRPESAEVYISKRDLGGNEIDGAVMRITGVETESGEKIEPIQWKSEAGKSHQVKLEPGQYTLTEILAPSGYEKADPVNFTVERDENDADKLIVKVNGQQQSTVTMTDAYTTHTVKVSKQSLTNGVGEIAGAELQITGTTLSGESIDPIGWTSDGSTKSVKLVPGSYKLHEKKSPSGYQPAPDITFTVALDGTVTVDGVAQDDGKIVMIDAPDETNVTVSKVAVSGTTELEGAVFELTGTTFEKNSVSERWTSSADGPKTFQLADGTYTLKEVKAPKGYDLIADPIAFTVSQGKVIVGDKAQSGNLIRVEDALKQYTRVSVRKRWEDSRNSENLREGLTIYAILQRNGKALATEGECTSGSNGYCVQLNDDNNWAYDWTGLPRNDDEGNRYSYTVSETIIDTSEKDANGKTHKDYYHSSIDKNQGVNGAEFTIYNIHQPSSVDIELEKDWKDGDNQDGLRPADGIGIQVYGDAKCSSVGDDGEAVEATCSDLLITTKLKPNADGEWKWTLENLPKVNKDGKEYTFRVVEDPVPGYNGYDLQGQCASDDKDKDGKPVCTTEISKTDADEQKGVNEKFTITNTHTPATTAVTVNKVWSDNDNFNGKRPDSVTIWLLSSIWDGSNGWPVPQNRECVGTKVVGVSCAVLTVKNAAPKAAASVADGSDGGAGSGSSTADTDPNVWTYTFKNLPKYYKGKQVNYSVTEEAVDDYTPLVKVMKSAAVTDDTATETATQTENGGTMQANAADSDTTVLQLTNTNTPETTSVPVRKAWGDHGNATGVRPKAIWVQIYERTTGTTGTTLTEAAGNQVTVNGSAFSNADLTGLKPVGSPVKLDDTNSWAYIFGATDDKDSHGVQRTLSKYKTYEVREVTEPDENGKYQPVSSVDGYQPPIITGSQDGKGYTITNTIIPTLPNTGGEGLARTMLFGLAFIALSGAFLASQLRDGNGMMIGGMRRGKHGKKGGAR
ncbi:Cna B-type domain-containing protein [Bifidobacterium ramosum]|uniref:Cna B-type domain-containing protein n=1 Tax=Bifidobacterium ramosum TaxID=1798158 RepID=UPI0013D82104|nr:Cna B-type domain-containing protein [Bifidobacterium ramosum]